MTIALVTLILVGLAWLLALSLHSTIARQSHGRWRGVAAERVPVNAAPMGAFRDEGSVTIPFEGVPREVRRASFVASLAAVSYLPQPFVLATVIAVRATWALDGYWMPAFLVGLLVSYACVLRLDAARLALLRRTPDAEWHARTAVRLVAAPHALLVAVTPALLFAVGPQPAAVWMALAACDLMSAGVVAAALVVRRAAGRYRHALDEPAPEPAMAPEATGGRPLA
jgi:hypothetical protein